MASMSNFIGQPLTWVGSDLITPDNSVIAKFPVETSGRWAGIEKIRWKTAKALVPDGTGTLFLNGEGPNPDYPLDVAIYTVEQGPRLAFYREPFLEFSDGRKFCWGRIGLFKAFKRLSYWGAGVWVDEAFTTTYVVIRDGFRRRRVDIWPAAAKLHDPDLSLLLVLGVYNIYIENTARSTEPEKGSLAGPHAH